MAKVVLVHFFTVDYIAALLAQSFARVCAVQVLQQCSSSHYSLYHASKLITTLSPKMPVLNYEPSHVEI